MIMGEIEQEVACEDNFQVPSSEDEQEGTSKEEQFIRRLSKGDNLTIINN